MTPATILGWQRRGWYRWDGTRWKLDDSAVIDRLTFQTAKSIWDEAKVAPFDEAAYLGKWAARSQNKSRLDAMFDLAGRLDGIATTTAMFDADTWLLNVQNGTIKLREHGRDDLHAHGRA